MIEQKVKAIYFKKVMIKLIILKCVFLIFVNCTLQKAVYIVEEINDDGCIELYYRVKLRSIVNDSAYQVLTERKEVSKSTIVAGDTIKIKIQKMDKSKWSTGYQIKKGDHRFYCNDKLILAEGEYFYSSPNLKGLSLMNQ